MLKHYVNEVFRIVKFLKSLLLVQHFFSFQLKMFSTITLASGKDCRFLLQNEMFFFLCFRGKQFSLPVAMNELGQQYTVVFAMNVTDPASECVCREGLGIATPYSSSPLPVL